MRHRCKGHRANIWRRPGAKHCSSLCSQSEGGEYCGGQARAENPTKLCPRALAMFATCSWPSLCEQSELQCWRRNRRLCGPVQISAARALPLTFDILILNTLPYSPKNAQIVFTITYSTFLTPPPTRKHFSTENSFKKNKFSVLGLAGFENLMYFCTVFHGIRFKVSEDWLSGDNQFFFAPTRKNRERGMSLPRFIGGTE